MLTDPWLWSKLHSQVAPGPLPLAWATFDMVGQVGVSNLVQEEFHWSFSAELVTTVSKSSSIHLAIPVIHQCHTFTQTCTQTIIGYNKSVIINFKCWSFTVGADPFGGPTLLRPWDDQSNSIENAKTRIKAAFEFMSKLGIRHYTFHDVYVSSTFFTVVDLWTLNSFGFIAYYVNFINKTGDRKSTSL